MIKVSVIVPVYNTEKHLEKCIKSIMEQSLKEIEIIAINDGSKDNSLNILKTLAAKDKRILIINKENEGVSVARNYGIKAAKGKYCLNVDSDDWIEKKYIEKMYIKAEEDNLDIVVSDIILDYENKIKLLNDLKIEKTISGEEYIKIFLSQNFYGYTWNKLIRKDIYLENNIEYKKGIKLYEDVDVILRLASCSKKIGKINQAFYHYIQHVDNCVNTPDLKKIYDIKIVFDSLIKYFQENGDKKLFFKLKEVKCKKLITHLWKVKDCSENKKFLKLKKDILYEIKNLKYDILDLILDKGNLREALYLYFIKRFPYDISILLLIKIDLKLMKIKLSYLNK